MAGMKLCVSVQKVESSREMSSETSTHERMGAVLFYGIVALLAYLCFLIFEPVLKPLAWSAIIVVFFSPLHHRAARRWGAASAAAASTAAVMLVLIVPVFLVGFAFVRQAVDAVRTFQQPDVAHAFARLNATWLQLQRHISPGAATDLPALIRTQGEKFAGEAAAEAGAVLLNVAVTVFDFVVMLLATFYFFRHSEAVMKLLRRALPFESETKEKILREARDLIFASVTSSLVVAVLLALLGSILFFSAGIRQPVFWGVLAGFFSFLPAIGSAIVWVPAGIWLLLHGQIGRGILLLAAFASIATVTDNVLRPRLIGGRAHLSELVIFVSVLGGIGVFGMLGIVLGPIVVATTASLLDIYTQRRPAASTG